MKGTENSETLSCSGKVLSHQHLQEQLVWGLAGILWTSAFILRVPERIQKT